MSDRSHVIGVDGAPVRVGDRVAFASTGWDKKAAMGVGVVRRITASRTTIAVEKASRHRFSDTSTIDDSLGRILKLEPVVSDDTRWRNAMEAAGVDNWRGYDNAMDIYNEETA